MRNKILIPLLAAVLAGNSLLFTGCAGSDVDITNINAEETTLSAEIESDALTDGNVTLHFVVYDYNGNTQAGVNVSISDESTQLFTGTTDDDGSLGSMSLPCNTLLTCSIRSITGSALGTSEMIFKLSGDYSSLTIYPPAASSDNDGIMQCVLEIPTDSTNLRAAIFATEDEYLSFANVTPWSDSLTTDAYATQATDSDSNGVSGDVSADAIADETGSEESDSDESDTESADDTESEDDSEDTGEE
ncbi:MAG: hypothetical protein LUC41_00580 [Clostridiales bacterium]|nr:hypothetical protein [Clostridiales bacterium]